MEKLILFGAKLSSEDCEKAVAQLRPVHVVASGCAQIREIGSGSEPSGCDHSLYDSIVCELAVDK